MVLQAGLKWTILVRSFEVGGKKITVTCRMDEIKLNASFTHAKPIALPTLNICCASY